MVLVAAVAALQQPLAALRRLAALRCLAALAVAALAVAALAVEWGQGQDQG